LKLGFGDPVPVSALHGRKSGDLLDMILEIVEAPDVVEEVVLPRGVSGIPRVSIVGRPNVGKSTLFNRLVGEDRSITHDMAGTTRDAIDTQVDTPDGPIVFVDTAGMRRKSQVDESAEYYSFVRALRAVDESDVALLVIDAQEGMSRTHRYRNDEEVVFHRRCSCVEAVGANRQGRTSLVADFARMHRRLSQACAN